VLFNTRNNSPSEKAPARIIDPLMHDAAGKVIEWPEGEAFEVRP
jgi:hypothetical protein